MLCNVKYLCRECFIARYRHTPNKKKGKVELTATIIKTSAYMWHIYTFVKCKSHGILKIVYLWENCMCASAPSEKEKDALIRLMSW